MFTIHLNKMLFYAHHGLHEEEAITGANFEVNVSVKFNTTEKITTLQQTINYVEVFAVVKKNMDHPVALLETLAENIAHSIHDLDDRITEINIHINKLHPPIKNFSGNVGVGFTKVF